MTRWTTDEIKYLKENYSTASKEEILKHVRHSWNSIQNMTCRVGLSRPYNTLSSEHIAEIERVLIKKYSWGDLKELRTELGISKTTLRSYAKKLGLARLPWHMCKRIQLEKSMRSDI